MARGRDLWFHLRDGPGSHVILPLNRGEVASEDLMLVGAALALHYSSLRGERAEVRLAHRADLDAVPGQLGKALVRKERSIFVDPRADATKQALANLGFHLTSSD
jgi:predicted ribosome quality control (RQC) complex YloA/Tae2 family protein